MVSCFSYLWHLLVSCCFLFVVSCGFVLFLVCGVLWFLVSYLKEMMWNNGDNVVSLQLMNGVEMK